MLSNLFISNYMFVDDTGLDLSLNNINIVLGLPSIKASIFMAPCLLGGVMSNLNIRYTTPRLSFGSFEEVVYNGTTNKPVTLYMRFKKFRRPLHESFYSLMFSASPVAFDKYSDEFKEIDLLDLYLEILGDRINMLRLIINEHILFSVSRHEVWTWKIEIDKKTIIEKSNSFPAVNFSGLFGSITDSIHYVDVRSWFVDKYQTLGTESMRALMAKKLIDVFSDLDASQKLRSFLKLAGDMAIRLRYVPPSSLGIEYRLSNSWKKMNFYDLDFISLLPTLAILLGSNNGDTIIISEPAIMSPKIQEILFKMCVHVALEENKQIVFLSNSPIIVKALLKEDTAIKDKSKLFVVSYDNRAHIDEIKFNTNGIKIDNHVDTFRQFWTDDLIDMFSA